MNIKWILLSLCLVVFVLVSEGKKYEKKDSAELQNSKSKDYQKEKKPVKVVSKNKHEKAGKKNEKSKKSKSVESEKKVKTSSEELRKKSKRETVIDEKETEAKESSRSSNDATQKSSKSNKLSADNVVKKSSKKQKRQAENVNENLLVEENLVDEHADATEKLETPTLSKSKKKCDQCSASAPKESNHLADEYFPPDEEAKEIIKENKKTKKKSTSKIIAEKADELVTGDEQTIS